MAHSPSYHTGGQLDIRWVRSVIPITLLVINQNFAKRGEFAILPNIDILHGRLRSWRSGLWLPLLLHRQKANIHCTMHVKQATLLIYATSIVLILLAQSLTLVIISRFVAGLSIGG